MSAIIFDELKFINNFVKEYNKNYSIIYFYLFLEEFIEIYTDNNTIDQNIYIINHYSNNSIENAIELFKLYYNSKFEFIGSKIDYAELASIVLFDKLFDKLLSIINDNYDSSNDTDLDD